MISVIVSSANPSHLKNVSKNIKETIGVPFEIIAVNNSSAEKGICEIYNLGAEQAQYQVLCFMHEDIEIKTKDWGRTICGLFKNTPDAGLIGIAGCAYKTIAPSGWKGSQTRSDYANIIQRYKFSDKKADHYWQNPDDQKLAKVAVVDGVWFCTTKKIALETRFDEDTFRGFHGYDVDFSLSVSRRYTVYVTFDVLIEHFSEGRYDFTWMQDNLKLHEKWNKYLPLNVKRLDNDKIKNAERATFKSFIDQLIALKLPMTVAFRMLRLNDKFFELDRQLFWKLNYYILKKYLVRPKA